jgi:SH3-like domain-containing protein
MKKSCLLLMGVTLLVVTIADARQLMSIQVREGQLRERPSYLGNVTATMEYGTEVQVQREQGPWRWVVSGNDQGWIHESALTRKRVTWSAGDEDVSGAASQEEMALAGKGFTAEVEQQYRAQHRDLDFTWVDRMEKMEKSVDQLLNFLRAGGVEPASEGGR